MSKKLIGLLLAVALVVGLLPMISLAAEAKTAKVGILSRIDMEVTQGGEAKYLKNSEYQGYNEDEEATSKGYTQVAGTKDDWNIKFEWKAGEAYPTLTFKDAKIDHLHDDGTKLFKANGDGTFSKVTTLSAILPKFNTAYDLKIVLQGQNLIEVDYGFIRGDYTSDGYAGINNLIIVGEEGSNLTMKPGTYGGSRVKKDMNVTLENVTATVTTKSYAPFSVSGKGILTVNNCNLNLSAVDAACLGGGWFPKDADGNVDLTPTIVINDSTLNLRTERKTITGCINNGAWGTAVANNSTIVAVGAGAHASNGTGGHAYWGGGLTLNNCNTNLTSEASYAVHLDDGSNPGAALKVNGGMLEITAASEAIHANAANKALAVDVSGNIKWTAKAGDTKEAAVAVTDATKLMGKYVQVSGRTPNTVKLGILSWSDVTAVEGGEAVYLKNSEYQGYNEDGEKLSMGYTQVAGTKDDWNVKFEFPVGGVPTLTFKDAKLDHLHDDRTQLYKEDSTATSGYKKVATLSAILPKSSAAPYDLKIVLQGNNLIEVDYGFVRGDQDQMQNITIVGEKDSNLNLYGGTFGTRVRANCNLTLDNVTATMAAGKSYGPLSVSGDATLTVKNSTLNLTGNEAACMSGNRAKKDGVNYDGKIAITGSTLTLATFRNAITGCLNNAGVGTATATDSTITATATGTKANAYWGSGLTLNNCTTILTSASHAVHLDDGSTPTAALKVNGGTLEITAGGNAVHANKANTALAVDVSGNPIWTGKAGDTKDAAVDVTDATKLTGKYVSVNATAFSSVTVTLANYTKMTLAAYDTPVYIKNASKEVFDTTSEKFTYWYPVAGDADNWNAKLEWKTGEAAPTLTLKGLKIDDFNNTTGKMRALVNEDGTFQKYSDGSVKTPQLYGIQTTKDVPLNIVITGEDSLIETYFGLMFKGNLDIKSEGAAKLTINTQSGGITTGGYKKASLTIDANLDVANRSYYNGDMNQGMIQTYKNTITINGGNINVTTTATYYLLGIVARGNDANSIITINGGNIKAHSAVGTGGPNGVIKVEGGQLIINDGDVSVTALNSTGFYAKKGVVINGGNVKSVTPYMGVFSGDEPALTVNGGTVEMQVESDVVDYYVVDKAPILGKGMGALVSVNNASDAVPYDGTNFLGHYIKIAAGLTPPDQVAATGTTGATTATEATTGTEAPTTGTEATTGTVAPTTGTEATTGTAAPTTATTPAGTNGTPNTGDNSHIVVWMSLMAISALAFVSIVLGKKKIA